jgi:hypothetical protein
MHAESPRIFLVILFHISFQFWVISSFVSFERGGSCFMFLFLFSVVRSYLLLTVATPTVYCSLTQVGC